MPGSNASIRWPRPRRSTDACGRCWNVLDRRERPFVHVVADLRSLGGAGSGGRPLAPQLGVSGGEAERRIGPADPHRDGGGPRLTSGRPLFHHRATVPHDPLTTALARHRPRRRVQSEGAFHGGCGARQDPGMRLLVRIPLPLRRQLTLYPTSPRAIGGAGLGRPPLRHGGTEDRDQKQWKVGIASHIQLLSLLPAKLNSQSQLQGPMRIWRPRHSVFSRPSSSYQLRELVATADVRGVVAVTLPRPWTRAAVDTVAPRRFARRGFPPGRLPFR